MFLKFSLSVISLCRYPNLVLMDATYKTCKLALPLFFLVVRTNVGYSVVAEFIIQHEDTTSITEALTILWQEVGWMWYWSGELHDRLPTVGREHNTCSFPRQCCVSVRVPPTSGVAPVAHQHQKWSQQLSKRTVWHFWEPWVTRKWKMGTPKRWWSCKSCMCGRDSLTFGIITPISGLLKRR